MAIRCVDGHNDAGDYTNTTLLLTHIKVEITYLDQDNTSYVWNGTHDEISHDFWRVSALVFTKEVKNTCQAIAIKAITI